MATDAQTAANRRNAQKSTGPKSAEGKAASRRNALKHALAGGADVLHDEDFALVDERVAAYRKSLRPADACGETLAAQMAVDSIRLERCRNAYIVLINDSAERATLCWDLDRRVEAADLAARLAADPEPVARRLEAFRQGAELLSERWVGLGDVLAETGEWTDAQRSLALDLLGVPHELRTATTPVDAPAGADAKAHRLALVAAEVDRLGSLRDALLDARDASERATAESGIGAELTAPLRLLHRYESAVARRWRVALHTVTKAREQAPAPPPAPLPAPVYPAASEFFAPPSRRPEPAPPAPSYDFALEPEPDLGHDLEPESDALEPAVAPARWSGIPASKKAHGNRRQRRRQLAKARQARG